MYLKLFNYRQLHLSFITYNVKDFDYAKALQSVSGFSYLPQIKKVNMPLMFEVSVMGGKSTGQICPEFPDGIVYIIAEDCET